LRFSNSNEEERATNEEENEEDTFVIPDECKKKNKNERMVAELKSRFFYVSWYQS